MRRAGLTLVAVVVISDTFYSPAMLVDSEIPYVILGSPQYPCIQQIN